MKKSHIQMPKVVLKEFQDKKRGSLHYYSFDDGKIHRGHAKTLNTEMGYYSDDTEEFLCREVESKLGTFICQLKMMKFVDGEDTPVGYEKVAFSHLYSLMARSPHFMKAINSKSVYFQLFDLLSQHDIAAQNGYLIACDLKLLDEFKVGFLVNKAEQPMVLPLGGVVQLNESLYCPLTPRRGICFIPASKMEGVPDNHIQVRILDDEMIKIFNATSFILEEKRNKRYVVSDDYDLLKELVASCINL